jgi:hypothetical protein
MARIPIYDSAASFDSSNAPLDQGLVLNTYKASKPIRMSGSPQPIYNVSYEWLIEGQDAWTFLWRQEFWGDKAGFLGQPGVRLDPTINRNAPWPYEQIEGIADLTGQVVGSDLIRRMSVTPTLVLPVTKWFMLGNNAPYVRIAIALATAVGQGQVLPRVRVWAHAVGYEGHYFEGIDRPYGGEFGI